MKKKTLDWLNNKTLSEKYIMFGNVKVKIKDYEITFGLLKAWIDSVVLICETFMAAYEKVMENRATTEQMDTWFENLLEAKTENVPASAPPVFAQIALPSGALEGLYKSFRKKMEFFKSNEAYNRAIGENLMIVAAEGTERNVEDASPKFKFTVDANGEITGVYVRDGFGGAELQWRVAGTETWHLADKSSETTINFKPEGITLPAKIELQGVYLLKNKRVGKWSPIYTLTIG